MNLRPLLDEAKRITYRLVAIVELLEHELGRDGSGEQHGG